MPIEPAPPHDLVPSREGSAEQLLPILESLPAPVIVGFEPTEHHVDVHVAELPPDERTGAAGLFCLVAEPSWTAIGVGFGGRARHMETREVVSTDVRAAVVVTRQGDVASRMLVDGTDQSDSGAGGVIVDSLHRALGLPSPGRCPTAAELAVDVWAHQVLELVLLEGHITWEQAVLLHPGHPGGGGPIGPSEEMLVEATHRAAVGFDWADLHERTASGRRQVPDLTPEEAAWMDTTMFARWVTGSLPDAQFVVRTLRSHGCEQVAERLLAVIDAVHAAAPG